MVKERPNQFVDATPAPEIEALLAMSKTMSIFDRLMAMPRADKEAATDWDRAVSNRLQVKVSGMMKACLEDDACKAA